MRMCFIHTPVPELKDDRLDPPVGLLYMATVLKRIGVESTVVDLSGMPEGTCLRDLPVADFYGFSTYTANYALTLAVKEVALNINAEAQTIAGGPHATALPEDVIKDFDYVVVGEGERAIVGIESGLPPNIYTGAPIGRLDQLPFPDYSLVDISSYTREFEGKFAFPIFTSRGCPHKCAFCSANSNLVRYRTVGNVVKEITALLDTYGDVSFRFKDDLFGANINWLREFGAAVPDDISYSCNVRGDCSQETVGLLAASGCKWACIGMESGSDRMLALMKKRMKISRLRRTVAELKSYGIKVLGWFIIGFPGETWDSVQQTVDLINELGLDKAVIYPLIPYPGTDVWVNRQEYGLRIIDYDFSHYFYIQGDYEAGFVYETDELSPGLIRDMRQYAMDNIEVSHDFL